MYSLEYTIIVDAIKKVTIIESVLALIYILSVVFKVSITAGISFVLFLFFFIILMLKKKSLTRLLERIINENNELIKRHTGQKDLDQKSFLKFNKKNNTYINIAQEVKNKKSKDQAVYNDMFVKLISKNYKNEYLTKKNA